MRTHFVHVNEQNESTSQKGRLHMLPIDSQKPQKLWQDVPLNDPNPSVKLNNNLTDRIKDAWKACSSFGAASWRQLSSISGSWLRAGYELGKRAIVVFKNIFSQTERSQVQNTPEALFIPNISRISAKNSLQLAFSKKDYIFSNKEQLDSPDDSIENALATEPAFYEDQTPVLVSTAFKQDSMRNLLNKEDSMRNLLNGCKVLINNQAYTHPTPLVQNIRRSLQMQHTVKTPEALQDGIDHITCLLTQTMAADITAQLSIEALKTLKATCIPEHAIDAKVTINKEGVEIQLSWKFVYRPLDSQDTVYGTQTVDRTIFIPVADLYQNWGETHAENIEAIAPHTTITDQVGPLVRSSK